MTRLVSVASSIARAGNGEVCPRTLSRKWNRASRSTRDRGTSRVRPGSISPGKNCPASSLVNQAKSWFQASAHRPCCGGLRGKSRVLTLRTRPPSGKNRSARFNWAISSGRSPENLRPSALSFSQFLRASRSLRATNRGLLLFQEARKVPSAVVA